MQGATILWSMAAAMSLLVAGIHFMVWARHRTAWASLALVLTSLGAAVVAAAEFLVMHAATSDAFAATIRWANFPILAVFIGIAWLVHLEFGTVSRWLAVCAVGLRALVLVLGYFPGVTPVFREISALAEITWLGERVVVVGAGLPTPWSWLPAVSNLALAGFVVDAAVRLWRRAGPGDRARALRVGVPISFFILVSSIVAMLINARVVRVPYITTPSHLAIVLMLGYELSREILRAQELMREVRRSEAQLRESERRLHLAGEAADLGFWFWNVQTGVLWATERAKAIFGFPSEPDVTFERFMQRVHPDDRAQVDSRIAAAIQGDGRYHAEYRVRLPDGASRWVAAHGEVSHGPDGAATSMTGVVFDTTERRRAELELAEQRHQLAHLSRVTTVSELSGSLAHEINQPLAIILTNAQAAQRLLAQDPPDLAEAREILADIVREDHRAGEVIRRLRGLLRNDHIDLRPLALPDLIGEVLHLLRRDLEARGVSVRLAIAPALPAVNGDPVQLQQVLLNLILNACEAMETSPAGRRVLEVSADHRDGRVRIAVADTGCGLPAAVERVFEPFYSTKRDGLGLGLSICRSIVTAHHGHLWAEPRPPSSGEPSEGGSVFHLELQALSRH